MRRTIGREYDHHGRRIVTYRNARGLWWIIGPNGRKLCPIGFGSLATAQGVADRHLPRPPPRVTPRHTQRPTP